MTQRIWFSDSPADWSEGEWIELREKDMYLTGTSTAVILGVLRRGTKKGLTAATIAARGNLNLNTTRSTLTQLVYSGDVFVTDTEAPEGGIGRPVNKYALTS